MNLHLKRLRLIQVTRLAFLSAILLSLSFCGSDSWAGVRGKAILIDAPSRTKPGNLILCKINGKERKLETLVEGKVIDAHFSPDGKQIVYGMNGTIKVLDLKTRASQDICPFETSMTYFNWGLDNKIYWSGGTDLREIFSVDIASKKKELIHKGNKGRSTMSLDGTKAAWVIPPVCSVIGGKTYRYMGGCGGAISPSGKYLTSNLTTTHKLMGILSFDAEGPSAKPIATVSALENHAINGFCFGRTDDWVCYVVEHPKEISPISYICFWQSNEHVQIAKQLCIKDFFDETDVIPDDAKLEKITVCLPGPTNTPLKNTFTNVGRTKPLKIVGHFSNKEGQFTPQLHDGITWKVDASKLALEGSTYKGVGVTERLTVTAEYQGKQDSFDVTVLPELTGNGFRAEFFSDTTLTNPVLTRTDQHIDFRWAAARPPIPDLKRRKPWAVRWTGMVDVQTEGEYTFYFLQGEGNDRFFKDENNEKKPCYSVSIDDKTVITRTDKWNYPWSQPKASAPIHLKQGKHPIKVITVDNKSSQPIVTQLYWSGPGIKQSLLGGGYVHSEPAPAK